MRKGLFIGINQYQNIGSLSGCVNDAMQMSSVLSKHADGRPNFHSENMISGEADLTHRSIEAAIKELFSGECDVALLYFAGHGHFDQNVNEGLLLCEDYRHGDTQLRVSDVLEFARQATRIKNKIIILDCCESGGSGSSRNLKEGESILGEGVTILTACRKEGVANEIGGHGVFTSLLLQALHGGAANVLGNVTPGSVYSFVDGALGPWQQRPVFKTNVSSFTALREAMPLVAHETLRELPDWFESDDVIFALTPEFEPTEDTYDPAKGGIFKKLQACNRHSLVEPVDAEHMYYAAINSTGCRLTALGVYYWSLAKKGMI
ncbi:caspase family protein [Vibrio jasicida]|uniref:caspase family protein n=1 Tax=Vibrio jasicida TaxID=766224 RepID=UPI000CE3CFBC|nr:caspase family protein [Vibrio jasicida]